MKKRFTKHFIMFTSAMSLCAAVLTGLPASGTSMPETEGGVPGSITEDYVPETAPETDPGIAPHNDLPPQDFREE